MALLRKLRPPEWPQKSTQKNNASSPQRHSRTSTSESSSGSEFSATSYSSTSSHEAPRRSDPKPSRLTTPGSRSSMPILPTQFQQYRHFSQSQSSPMASASHLPQPDPMAYPADQWSPQRAPIRHISEQTADDSNPSMSEDDSDLDGSSCSESAARNHPYYHQWKQYYETLAASRNGDHTQAAQPPPSHHRTRSSVYIPQSPLYKQVPRESSPNNLLLNSRRSTLKSNRSASVPSLSQEQMRPTPGSRSVSINTTLPESRGSFDPRRDVSPRRDFSSQSSKPSGLVRSKRFSLDPQVQSVASGLNKLAIHREDSGQISDYAAFLLEDTSASEMNDTMSTMESNPNDTYIPDTSADEDRPVKWASTNSRPETLATLDDALTSSSNAPVRSDASDSHTLRTEAHQSPQQTITQTQAVLGDLNRQNSTASTSSYNSLQSEGNLIVGRHPNRVAKPAPKVKQDSHRPDSTFVPDFMPPISGPPPPMMSPTGSEYSPAFSSSRVNLEHRRSSSALTGSASPMNNAYMQQIQQQIQQIQQFQQMQQMQMKGPSYRSTSPQAPSSPTYSSDATINKRIEEFVKLRQVIASGNKTFEYRVQWLQMLITATNYKLFAYINIKGEPVPSEHTAANKQFFIRSCVNHLSKLLRELDSDRLRGQDKHLAEVCFIQGCLYRHSYVEKFGQDFGFEYIEEEAERFFNLCLQYNPAYFRAYYELGQLYEAQADEDKFDIALENYKESAQMGYNRAIYKVALIHLLVPKVRSTKFLKYFRNLAAIDMESAEVELSGPDRDELEEVVGLAQFQLAKIYEGIYPGDMTIEDDFVRECLELAPVNYSKSLSYYNRSARLNCLLAQVRLGHIYEDGELNRNYNPTKSISWFIKASTSPLKFKRHPEAMLGLSRWFLKGSDGANKHIPYPNPESAVQWCERACKEFGLPEAFYQMGLLCEQGYVADDPSRWYEEAYRGGHPEAAQRLGLAPMMGAGEEVADEGDVAEDFVGTDYAEAAVYGEATA